MSEGPAPPRRPALARALALFCLGTLAFTAWRDLALPQVRDVEVWAGFELRGAWARASAPLHWALFAVGAWAFWRERPWIWSAAAGYALYVAASHAVWNLSSPRGGGWTMGLLQLALFSLPAAFLWWARPGRAGRC